MTTMTVGGATIELDEGGFFRHPELWHEEMAPEIAAREGLPELSDRHWQVIRFMRQEYLAHGAAPSVRALSKGMAVPVKELYQLFPKGPAKVAAKIAGVPKPVGCI